MDQIKHIAVLMTCYNRRETTLRCLRALYGQALPDGVRFEVYLMDDGCTDGTGDAVREQFPAVRVLHGDGNLYWCGGMRIVWAEAMKEDYDAYLWLNDDTMLLPGAIQTLLSTAREVREKEGREGIVVGSCCDPRTGVWTYGGRATPAGNKSLTGTPVIPDGRTQFCQMVNGNVVLVPAFVHQRLGIFDDRYTHVIGDMDYGFRAFEEGIPVVVAPCYLATCSPNGLPAWCDPHVSLGKRLALFNSPKGIHFSEFMRFHHRHFGWKGIRIACNLIVRTIFPSFWLWKARLAK